MDSRRRRQTPSRRPRASWAALALGALLALAGERAPAQGGADAIPSFAQLEAAGARIGTVRVITQDIFDTADPEENNALFRWANRVHIKTRPDVIERALLFKTGDPVSARVIEEAERLLRANRFLYDVDIRPVAWRDGVVDVDVMTRDTWSLDPGISAGRSGGVSTGGIHVNEYNLLGTGTTLGLGRSKGIDRSGSELRLANDHILGTWASLSLSHATNSDGRRDEASLVRPFYALDTRWAAGVMATKDNRIESIYSAGRVVNQYRHRQTAAELFGGWSSGLVDGWVRRQSVGLGVLDDAYAAEPGAPAPPALPPNRKLVAPFLRLELLEDRYARELNRNLIGRPEFFDLGLSAAVQLGRAATGLGSSDDAWLYAASVKRGFTPSAQQALMTSAELAGQYAAGQVRRQRVNAQAQYYLHQSRHRLFYAAVSVDRLTRPHPEDLLQLGGDDGLRGYPLHYQSGTRRTQLTLEQRFYTDIYLWRLFRIGGAAFFDAGRAWGGAYANTLNPGWLRDAGVGLRIVSTRSAFSNVLHVDVALPLNATPDIRKAQLRVRTRASF